MKHCLALLFFATASVHGQTAAKKLEAYVLLPEPAALRTELSRIPEGSHKTVLSPARETIEAPGVKPYSKEEFAKLGIGMDTFVEHAKAAAEVRLKAIQPEFIKDEDGKTRYAVYRGDSPLIASLLIAPSFGKVLAKLFNGDLWAVVPDRHSLFLFPAKPELLEEFTADLMDRYKSDPYAASCEVFLIKPGEAPKVVATFGD